ncbi:arabinosylfuranosidase ArfA [Massiliimalia massiliensis]|uniref:arabinosylfuranosidase ArfA n=1 Tax=Massiliimalia massiliensis TaxID=1852384 RepID=UPI000985173B|nr:alpha-N-arabinofuranosidase [Massiliimalia massiliensis]
MDKVKLYIEKDFTLAEVDDRLYSSFLEHLGRAIYEGIYEPGHPAADQNGFRQDVLELVRELNVSHVRYPGGNFVSGYDWKDGIGPKENRPTRLELAWKSIETNQFGIDEFYDWSKKAGTEIMGAVNLGTGTPKDAGEMLEYCNYPGGTYWSDLRIKNGHKDPYNIKLWCLGNEMDGEWQICHLDADDYGKKAVEAAKIMKWIDDSIEVVACGSATVLQKTYPEWDRVVLEHAYDHVDYLSMHRYYENEGNDLDFLASFIDMDDFINTITSTCDYVKAVKRSKKRMMISFDEWNVWYQAKQEPHDWLHAPHILEDQYSLLDALVFAGLGMTLINHADRVKVACLAQLVNVIAPIFTEKGGKAIRQSTFYPFKYLSTYGRGTVLKPVNTTPTVETRYGDAPVVSTTAVYDQENGMVNLFCLNIHQSEAMPVEIDLRSFGKLEMVEHMVMDGNNLMTFNSIAEDCNVVPRQEKTEPGEKDIFELALPKLSFHVIRFAVK